MSDRHQRLKAIPTDEASLRAQAVAELLSVQGPIVFQAGEDSSVAYLRLQLRRGFDKYGHPILAADLDDLRVIARQILEALGE